MVLNRFSTASIFLLIVIGFSLPVAPDSRLVFFDLIAFWVCIINFKNLARTPQIKALVFLFFLYQIILFVSTLVHGLPIINFFRRSYIISLLVIEISALYLLIIKNTEKKQRVVIVAVVLGVAMHYFYPVDQRVSEAPIKFLLGLPFGVFLAFILSMGNEAYSRGKRLLLTTALISYSIFCFFIGSRMVGAVFFISSLVIWGRFDLARKLQYKKKFIFYLLLAVFFSWSILELYTYLAINGVFGEQAKEIAEFQSHFSGGILLGGRPEIIVNIAAFLDSPFLGGGPVSLDPKYLSLFASIGVYSKEIVYNNEELIYHSMLFSAAQEGGFFATLIWVFLIIRMVYAIPLIISLKCIIAPVAIPLLISGVWHIVFSPLISYNRWLLALACALAFWIADIQKNNLKYLAKNTLISNKRIKMI